MKLLSFNFQSTLIDLGPSSFPRHIRNVTCDEHKRCYHSRAKGLHCLPIHYQVSPNISIDFAFSSNYQKKNYFQVSVIKMREYRVNPESSDAYVLPQGLRCCWKAMNIPTVVGCVCGPHY